MIIRTKIEWFILGVITTGAVLIAYAAIKAIVLTLI
jgi:hypothetical protein